MSRLSTKQRRAQRRRNLAARWAEVRRFRPLGESPGATALREVREMTNRIGARFVAALPTDARLAVLPGGRILVASPLGLPFVIDPFLGEGEVRVVDPVRGEIARFVNLNTDGPCTHEGHYSGIWPPRNAEGRSRARCSDCGAAMVFNGEAWLPEA